MATNTIGTGAALGAYKVIAALGAGGMGDVWRAEDTRLGREVALKLLPAEFAGDPERMARFEREARVLASLNHPNIATLYGLESASVIPSATDGHPAVITSEAEGNSSVILREAQGRPKDLGWAQPARPDPSSSVARSPQDDRGNGVARSPQDDRGNGVARSPQDDRGNGAARSPQDDRGNGVARSPQDDRGNGAARSPQDDNGGHADERLAQDDSGAVTFLVMELVDGEDLSDRIARGPIPLEEAIPIALQISEALESAHDHGIAHRDLKPANIKLRADGTSLVFSGRDSGGEIVLYVRDLDVAEARKLPGTEHAQYPFWSPDSRSVGFFSAGRLLFMRDSTLMARAFDADRIELVGDAVPVSEDVLVLSGAAVAVFTASDSGVLAYQSGGGNRGSSLTWVDRGGTPDGTLGEQVFYREIYLTPFPGPGRRWRVSTDGGMYSSWRSDGLELYYQSPDGDIMSAAIATQGEIVTIGSPTRLLETQDTGLSYPYSPAPDGERFLIISPQSGPQSLNVVSGWDSELEGDRRR